MTITRCRRKYLMINEKTKLIDRSDTAKNKKKTRTIVLVIVPGTPRYTFYTKYFMLFQFFKM